MTLIIDELDREGLSEKLFTGDQAGKKMVVADPRPDAGPIFELAGLPLPIESSDFLRKAVDANKKRYK